MKLKNKISGEIKEFVLFDGKEMQAGLTLENLTQEWEDYEEPKEYWYINTIGAVGLHTRTNGMTDSENSYIEDCQLEIGNYFATKEEAEKAVEKLKAWKRLKDGGFVFCGKGDCLDTIKFDYGPAGYNNQDFNLLFGGEK